MTHRETAEWILAGGARDMPVNRLYALCERTPTGLRSGRKRNTCAALRGGIRAVRDGCRRILAVLPRYGP